MPSATAQRKILRDFIEVTQARESVAQAYLRNNSYHLQAAIDEFLAKKPEAENEIKIDEVLDKLFTSIEPKASHNELETEEVMAYCEALDVNMGSYEYFVLADIVQAQSFGQITRQGFVKGWKQVYEDTGKRVTPDMAAHSKYVRAQIDRLRTDAALFGRVYRTAFTTGKELGKREMGMTEALAYWEELFKPAMGGWRTERVDWLGAWTAYLREKFGTETDGDWEYSRSVSRDLWNQTRLFAAKTMEDETLGFWSEEQAWPGLIDEFVVWCREKGKVPAQNGEAMEVEE